MSRLVVKSHRPLQLAIAVVLLSTFLSIVTWTLLDQSHWNFILGQLARNNEHRLLWEVNQGLEDENREMREHISMLERTSGLDKQTETLLQTDIKELQQEIFRLKGELVFYQGIMEAAGQAKGLDVHQIYVRQLSHRNTYRLKLILTNVASTDAVAEGDMEISIEGIASGATTVLKLVDVTLDKALDMTFKVRNFKRFESNIQLPDGFSPQRVFVNLQPKDKKQSKIRKVFDWPATVG